jgi:hypothetical protein
MSRSRITVGDVEIRQLYDLVADFPIPLDHAFPAASAEAWEPYRREYPSLFSPGNLPHFHVGCYLIRSPRWTMLVDTGIGPASRGMATWLRTSGQLACDEDAYRILSAPGQPVSSVDDPALRMPERAGRGRRPERVTPTSAADGVCPARASCCRIE